MRLVAIDGASGKAEINGVGRDVRLDLVPEATLGQFVIVHAGYAIQTLDEEAAHETLALLSQMFEEET